MGRVVGLARKTVQSGSTGLICRYLGALSLVAVAYYVL